MGKINSVIEFTGKTGNLVGVKGQDGEVYLRKRLRHVKNGNTEQQVSVRAKIALAGSLSKIIPSEMLYGMKGSGKQGRRQRWMRTVMQRMSVTVADGKVQAVLAPSDLLLSEGPYSFGVVVDTPAIAEGKLTMNATLPDDVERIIVAAVFADSENGGFHVVGSTVVESTGVVEMPLPDAGYRVVNLYVIPITKSNSVSGVSYSSDVEALAGTDVGYASTAGYYNSNRYVWMHSIFVGTVTAMP